MLLETEKLNNSVAINSCYIFFASAKEKRYIDHYFKSIQLFKSIKFYEWRVNNAKN